MKKFSEFSEQDQIVLIKDQFAQLLETYAASPDELKKIATEEQLKSFTDFLPKIKKNGCFCGRCLNSNELLASLIPRELDVIIDLARKTAQEATY